MRRALILGAALVAAATPLQAQRGLAHPLGVTFGMSRAALERRVHLIPVPGAPFTYRSRGAPTPSAEFGVYLYTITPKHGLCSVGASTPPFGSDPGGDEVRRRFDALRASLDSKYGPSGLTDEMAPTALWSTPNAWVLSLAHNERTLKATWAGPGIEARFSDVGVVSLSATASSSAAVSLLVVYTSADGEACNAEIQAAASSVL